MPAKVIMKKFKAGTLHSGDPKGPIVTNPHQAKAIQMSYARKEGAHIPKKGGNTNLDSGSMKCQSLMGRRDNLKSKAIFKVGPQAEK